MNRYLLLSLGVSFASALSAQSNTVVGLNGRLETLDNITYWGRSPAVHPAGVVGMSMRNTMCNPGSVSIPWYAQMAENHPKFGFIITRLSGDRMVQISDRSYCKHAFTSASTSGACGPCNGIGGNLMGVTCSDTYTAGHNAGRGNLGPADEINPWLGTWPHTGSFFDQGFPNVGSPGNNDGNQSPINISDPVTNRVTIKETDLLVAGSYYYGIQLIHEGEAVAVRGDNIKSRGMTATWNGSNWSVANSAVGEVFGSILQHWTGADLNSGGNGNDDGRFFVGSKATSLGGGNYHYEYAVHNVDNNRGGATLRVPIDASAVATNFSFRDIDGNPLNDWTSARVGNEIVFTAPPSNPLNWNEIFNFGFDATFAPGNGGVTLDEARVGPGALFVAVAAKVPSGSTFAQVTSVGTGCGGTPGCANSFYELSFDLANSGFTMTPTAGGYAVSSLLGAWITPAGSTLALTDDSGTLQAIPFALPFMGSTTNNLWVCSNGFVSTANNGTSYTPSASAFLGGQPTWAAVWRDLNPSTPGGSIRFDANASRVVVSFVNVANYSGGGTVTCQWQFYPSGLVHVIYQAATGSLQTLVGFTRGGGAADPGAIDISAALPTGFALCHPGAPSVPALALAASARPILGTTFNFNTTNIPAGSLLGLQVLSQTQYAPGIDLTSIGMPGCTLHLGLDVLTQFATPGASASVPYTLPSTPSLSGAQLLSQSVTLSPGQNPFGFVISNALLMVLGIN